jgi:hypothetical protein
VKEEDSGSVVVVPGTAEPKLTTYPPEVHVPEPEALTADSRKRRWMFAIVGVGAAGVDLAAGLLGGSGPHGLSMAGLILDIAGAFLLTTGLMQPDWLIREMGFARYDENLSITTYWRLTRAEARVAAVILFCGFTLQALGTAISR